MATRDVPLRELRNQVSEVLRRVEAGERIRVTVNRRPVAEIVPLPRRREAVPWSELELQLPNVRADAALAAELRTAAPDTTTDV